MKIMSADKAGWKATRNIKSTKPAFCIRQTTFVAVKMNTSVRKSWGIFYIWYPTVYSTPPNDIKYRIFERNSNQNSLPCRIPTPETLFQWYLSDPSSHNRRCSGCNPFRITTTLSSQPLIFSSSIIWWLMMSRPIFGGFWRDSPHTNMWGSLNLKSWKTTN